MEKTVSSPITRGQANELVNQIENAIKSLSLNPTEKASELIKNKTIQKMVEDYLKAKVSVENQVIENPIPTPLLTQLFTEEKIMIEACDGTKTIADSRNVFSRIDSDFKNWNANDKGKKTEEVEVKVFEMAKNANFAEMFGSLSKNPESLCFTQEQILNFISNQRRFLRKDGYGTFFLFKSGGEFFVADVYFYVGGSLTAPVNRFGRDYPWDVSDLHRLVVPATGLLVS